MLFWDDSQESLFPPDVTARDNLYAHDVVLFDFTSECACCFLYAHIGRITNDLIGAAPACSNYDIIMTSQFVFTILGTLSSVVKYS